MIVSVVCSATVLGCSSSELVVTTFSVAVELTSDASSRAANRLSWRRRREGLTLRNT